MSWNRAAAAAALAAALEAATNDTVTVLDRPPATFNPPALIVQYPQTVTRHTPAFATDLATLTILGAVGLEAPETLDALLDLADQAISADPTLGDVVQAAKPTELRNWRILPVAGAEYLSAELALTIQM